MICDFCIKTPASEATRKLFYNTHHETDSVFFVHSCEPCACDVLTCCAIPPIGWVPSPYIALISQKELLDVINTCIYRVNTRVLAELLINGTRKSVNELSGILEQYQDVSVRVDEYLHRGEK